MVFGKNESHKISVRLVPGKRRLSPQDIQQFSSNLHTVAASPNDAILFWPRTDHSSLADCYNSDGGRCTSTVALGSGIARVIVVGMGLALY
jgi:hypothetical protein